MKLRWDVLVIVVCAGLLIWLGKAPGERGRSSQPRAVPSLSQHNACIPTVSGDGYLDANGELAGGG